MILNAVAPRFAHAGFASARRWGSIYCTVRCKDGAASVRQRETRGRVATHCQQCGGSLTGKRIDARFCGEKCGNDFHNNHRATQARIAKLAARRPCIGCGGKIPEGRSAKAIYCTDTCKSRSRRHQTYNLTKSELELLLGQHDKCAICKTENWGKKGPQVDHCHTTGRVRGVLCNNCNNGLGRFKDNPAFLRAAAAYVEEPTAFENAA